LPDVGETGVQEATGTFVVLFGVQVVVTNELPGPPVDAEQVATGTLVVVTGLQVIVVQAFAAVAVCAVQLAAG